MQYNTIFWIIVTILVVQFTWDQIRAALNRSQMSDTLPPQLEGIYDETEYARQQQYQRTTGELSLVEQLFSTVLLLAVLFTGTLGALEGWLAHYIDNTVLLAVAFIAVATVAMTVISIPFNYYDTFVIEERFGFNKATKKVFWGDMVKNLILMLILISVVIGVIVFFHQLTPQWFWVWAWGILTLFSVGIGYFYSQLIVPLFNTQTPLEEGSLRDTLFELAQRTGFEIQDVYTIDGSKRSTKANAYFTGFGKRKRIVLYDTLIDELEDEEIAAVLAHEIGHYKKRHIIQGLVIGTLLTGVQLWLMSLLLKSPQIAAALGNTSGNPSIILGIIGFFLLFGPLSETLSAGQNVLSRYNEYQADAFADTHGYASALISGLKKISSKALSNLTPHPVVVFWTYSHPTLLQRMDALDE